MNIHRRLIDRLIGLANNVLGVCKPTLGDLSVEVQRVYGPDAVAHIYDDGMVGLAMSSWPLKVMFYCPTIAAAYAALRTLPDFGEKE